MQLYYQKQFSEYHKSLDPIKTILYLGHDNDFFFLDLKSGENSFLLPNYELLNKNLSDQYYKIQVQQKFLAFLKLLFKLSKQKHKFFYFYF